MWASGRDVSGREDATAFVRGASNIRRYNARVSFCNAIDSPGNRR